MTIEVQTQNPLRLFSELHEANISFLANISSGAVTIAIAGDATQEQEVLMGEVIAKHDPTFIPTREQKLQVIGVDPFLADLVLALHAALQPTETDPVNLEAVKVRIAEAAQKIQDALAVPDSEFGPPGLVQASFPVIGSSRNILMEPSRD